MVNNDFGRGCCKYIFRDSCYFVKYTAAKCMIFCLGWCKHDIFISGDSTVVTLAEEAANILVEKVTIIVTL